MRHKAPAFQLYAGEWLSERAISLMTPAEEGAYIRLLCYAWLEPDCALPDDDEVLAKISRLNRKWKNCSHKIRVCFSKQDSKLVSEQLLKEREKQRLHSEQCREKGLKSGISRNRGSTPVEPEANRASTDDCVSVEPEANSSSSLSSSSSSSCTGVPSDKNHSPHDPTMQEPLIVNQTPTKVEPNPEPIAKAKKPPKPKPPPKPKRDPLADPIADRPDLAELWDTAWGWIKTRHPGARSRQPDAGTPHWTSDRIALMHIVDIDNLSANDVRVALNWAFNVEAPQGTWPGWADQVRSIAGLRKLNSQGISKIHSIIEKAWRHRSQPAASNGSPYARGGSNGFGGRGGAYVPFNGSAGIPPGSIKRKYTDEDYRIANERGGFDSDRSTYDAPRFMDDRTPEEVAADEAALAKLDIELAAIRGGKGPEINFDDLPF
jgi:uncharacterized protein YdaU (DUF1376 family)